MSALSVTSVACPGCGASVGDWCERHGKIQPGPLLACVMRRALTAPSSLVACPVGTIAADIHYFIPGTGKTVMLDMMGDPARHVEVCLTCAEHSETD